MSWEGRGGGVSKALQVSNGQLELTIVLDEQSEGRKIDAK